MLTYSLLYSYNFRETKGLYVFASLYMRRYKGKMRTYEDIRNDIKTLLLKKGLRGNSEKNRKINEERVKAFRQAITELKESKTIRQANFNGIDISTDWLRNLLKEKGLNWREENNKVGNLTNQANFKTEQQNYYFHEWHRVRNL